MKKNLHTSALILIGILLVLFAYVWHRQESAFITRLRQFSDHDFADFTLGNQTYRLEIVSGVAATAQGLSDRSQIGSDGMLFVMPTASYYSFWMPRMNFDLDILWLRDNQLVEIMSHVPREATGTPAALLPLYTNSHKANLVLEIAAGRAERDGLKVGDTFRFKQ